MIFPRLRRRRPDTISSLYGTIVAQARLPCFYQDYAIADTVNGRFDLIVLHLVLVIDRLAADPALHELGQGLFDHFCRDMDDNLREMGIGDLAVPKQMRRVGEAFYGCSQAYRAALATGDDGALLKAVARNLYAAAPATDAARRLVAYIMRAARELKAQEAAQLTAGQLRWPDPALVAT